MATYCGASPVGIGGGPASRRRSLLGQVPSRAETASFTTGRSAAPFCRSLGNRVLDQQVNVIRFAVECESCALIRPQTFAQCDRIVPIVIQVYRYRVKN